MFEKSPGQNDFMTLSLYYKYIIIIAYILNYSTVKPV